MNWIAWSIASAMFAALTAILAKAGVAHVDSNLATAIRTSVVVVFAWLVVLLSHRNAAMQSLDRRTWMFLTASGIATACSWLCYFRALSLGPVSKVAPLDKLSVVLVVLLAWPVLGERPSGSTVLGSVLLAAGAIVLTLSR